MFGGGIWLATGRADEGLAPSAAHEVLFPASRPAAPARTARPRIGLSVTPRRVRADVRVHLRFRATTAGRRPVSRALIRFAGHRTRTDRRGRATIVTRLHRPGRRRAVATHRGLRRGTAIVVVVGRS